MRGEGGSEGEGESIRLWPSPASEPHCRHLLGHTDEMCDKRWAWVRHVAAFIPDMPSQVRSCYVTPCHMAWHGTAWHGIDAMLWYGMPCCASGHKSIAAPSYLPTHCARTQLCTECVQVCGHACIV